MNAQRLSAVVTCEHGGNRIPPRYRGCFAEHRSLLASHRGFDAGALDVARHLARRLDAPLIFSTVSRLVVDLNRSEHHPRLFSSVMRSLDDAERRRVLHAHYYPHRSAVHEAITRMSRHHPVVHLGIHSFTPTLDGKERAVEIGFLYDPSRSLERRLCIRWKAILGDLVVPRRIRLNQPYRGVSDGLTRTMRGTFAPERYLGVEVEINQKELTSKRDAARWARWLAQSLASLGDGERP